MAHEKKVVETPVEYDPQYILQVKDLKKHFPIKGGMISKTVGHVKAVDGVTFNLKCGTTMGLVGESGCGKTTTGRTILRLAGEKTGGQVLFNGKDVYALSDKEMRDMRTKMQIIFQDPYSSLNPRKSVAEIIATPLKVNHICKDRASLQKRVRELMDTVGLAERLYDAYPHELDGGRRQRICIARALAINPKFIVCDEPVSALDVSIQAQILNLLMDLQDEMGLTYMFITHDLSVVKHISSEIMVMYLGRCVEYAPANELFENPVHPYTKALLSAIPIPDISMRGKNIQTIRGEVSSPINPKPGCRFAPRCDFACESCTAADIPLRQCGPNHYVACCCAGE